MKSNVKTRHLETQMLREEGASSSTHLKDTD